MDNTALDGEPESLQEGPGGLGSLTNPAILGVQNRPGSISGPRGPTKPEKAVMPADYK